MGADERLRCFDALRLRLIPPLTSTAQGRAEADGS